MQMTHGGENPQSSTPVVIVKNCADHTFVVLAMSVAVLRQLIFCCQPLPSMKKAIYILFFDLLCLPWH